MHQLQKLHPTHMYIFGTACYFSLVEKQIETLLENLICVYRLDYDILIEVYGFVLNVKIYN